MSQSVIFTVPPGFASMEEYRADVERRRQEGRARMEAVRREARRPDVLPNRTFRSPVGFGWNDVVDDIDDNDFYDASGEANYRRMRVTCLRCKRAHFPFRSRRTECYTTGWRWVAYDHQEPYAEYLAQCPHCRTRYRLGVHTSQ